MPRAGALLLVTLVPSLAAASVSSADAIRCGGRLVEVGMTALTLRARCGEPAYTSALPEYVGTEVQVDRKTFTRTWSRQLVETWAYPGDPGDLLRLIVVRDGRVHAIHLAGRVPLEPEPRCWQGALPEGTWLGEAALRCGEPDDRTSRVEEVVTTDLQGLEVRRVYTHEQWIYDPGPGRFIRALSFVNGKLSRVEVLERSPSVQ